MVDFFRNRWGRLLAAAAERIEMNRTSLILIVLNLTSVKARKSQPAFPCFMSSEKTE